MLKKVSFVALAVLTTGFFANAQSERGQGLRELSLEVHELIEDHADELSRDERREVRSALRHILSVIGTGRQGSGRVTPGRGTRFVFCESANNQLIDSNGQLIFDFGSLSDCQTAKSHVERGEPFCETGNNQLFTSTAQLIHDFGSSSDCQEARDNVARGLGYCDFANNTLHEANGRMIFDFSSRTDCQNALNRRRR